MSRPVRMRSRGEDGSVLILALVFLTVVGLIGGALIAFAGTSLATTNRLQEDRTQSYASQAALDVAIQNVRGMNTSGNTPGYSGVACPTTTATIPQGGTNVAIQVACAVGTAPLPYQRTIVFAACPAGATASSCLTGGSTFTPIPGPSAIVVATALLYDLKPGCTGATPATCFAPGTALDLKSWVATQASG